MSEYYTQLAEQADALCARGIPIAKEPGLYFSGQTAHLQHKLQVDFDLVREMAARKGKDPERLSALGIGIVTPQQLEGYVGSVLRMPAILDDQVHYPVIQLAVAAGTTPKAEKLNMTFRHEFQHVMQERDKTLYNSKLVQTSVAVGGTLLAFAGAKIGYDGILAGEAGDICAGAGMFIGGMFTSVAPHVPLWFMSPSEMGAEFYARRHRFSPISITE